MGRGFAPVQKSKTLDKMIKARKYWLSGEGMAEVEIKAGDKFFVPWPFSYVYDHEENTLALVPGFASIDREDGYQPILHS